MSVYFDLVIVAALASQVEPIGLLVQPEVSNLANFHFFAASGTPIQLWQDYKLPDPTACSWIYGLDVLVMDS
jgi:hypothetical protein